MARRVLFVDDDAFMREVATLSLNGAGWDVTTLESGAEAVGAAADKRPDVILLDLVMPDPDGRATLKALQDNSATSGIPVVFLTAKEDAKLGTLGAAGVLQKPFNPMTLPQELSELLGWA